MKMDTGKTKIVRQQIIAVLKLPLTGVFGTNKGVWWMPRLRQAMKDAAWRRYASGRCQATFDPEMSEWGNPVERNLYDLVAIQEV